MLGSHHALLLEIKYNCVTIELWTKIIRTVLFLMNVLFYVWYLCDYVHYQFVRLYAISVFAVFQNRCSLLIKWSFLHIKVLKPFLSYRKCVNVDHYRSLNRSFIPISQEIWSRFGVSNLNFTNFIISEESSDINFKLMDLNGFRFFYNLR